MVDVVLAQDLYAALVLRDDTASYVNFESGRLPREAVTDLLTTNSRPLEIADRGCPSVTLDR